MNGVPAKPTAMFIDDDPIDRSLYERLVKRNDVFESVEIEVYADEALEKLVDGSIPIPDIIFLDLNIPRMSGLEFVAAIERRMSEQIDQVFIVIATTSDFENDKTASAQFRCVHGFFTKPLEVDHLKHAIRQFENWSGTGRTP